jgi:hypothetical protein
MSRVRTPSPAPLTPREREHSDNLNGGRSGRYFDLAARQTTWARAGYDVAGVSLGCLPLDDVFETLTPYSYWLSTAGHCTIPGKTNARQHPQGTTIGDVVFSHAGDNVDAALIRISSTEASNKMWHPNGIFTITSREAIGDAVIGEYVCSSRRSGASCGNLQSKNVLVGGYVDGQFAATGQYVYGGDSGSPVYYGSQAMGIMIANLYEGSSIGYYTPIQSVEAWSSFRVLTSAPT